MAKKVLVIGATGHVGTYLVPRLVEAGFDVAAMSRGDQAPYLENDRWASVERVVVDRAAAEADGSFVAKVQAVGADIVIDMISFEPDSARLLAEGLSGRVGHFLHTGTIWTHGTPVEVPVPEEAVKRPFGDYGIKKAAIEAQLLALAGRDGFPVTIVHPGHIVGKGWLPLNPAGHFGASVWRTIARGEVLDLPNFGLETVHHVHADDIAALFMAAIGNREASLGQSFHSVSPRALTLRGYAEAMYQWFGQEPKLQFLPFADWAKGKDPGEANATWEHIARSPNCSMEKAERLLGYRPAYSSIRAVTESVQWLIEQGKLTLA
jgi:nucleoside-diphosphate-sugar epimerase